jgi:hypothetical protein
LSTSFRNISSGSCGCITGYYNVNNNVVCQPCIYSCLNCSAATTCTACNGTAHRVINNNNCLCSDGYYDDGNNTLCQPCFSTCFACNGPAITDCVKCNTTTQKRDITIQFGTCDCITGYF